MTRKTRIPQPDHADNFAWFLTHVAQEIAAPEREARFHATRDWRLDFYWPAQRLALEIDGGRWASGGGRHATDDDLRKMNAAAAAGIRVMHASPKMVDENPWQLLDDLKAALAWRSA